MHPPGANAAVVRYGELFTKSGPTRERMEGRLAENVATLLDHRGVPGAVEVSDARIVVRTTAPDRAASAAADAFGVVSSSPAASVAPTRDAIETAIRETARACYDGGTFAVDANRGDDALPFTSDDVEEFGGAAVFDADTDADPIVDLDDPGLTFHVDCRTDEAFVFVERRDGPGGLPLGSQAGLVALVSGGLDSPVAAYEAMRRGSPVLPVYVDLGDYGGPDHRARAVAAMRTLRSYAPDTDLPALVVPGGDAVSDLVADLDSGRMLAIRRFMLRVGDRVAREYDLAGVVTGESVGQKSSQTAANLAATDPATSLPVHRPLLTVDKADVADRARTIGTFDDAVVDAGCHRLAPAKPATAADPARVREAEPADLFACAAAAAADAERVDLTPPASPHD